MDGMTQAIQNFRLRVTSGDHTGEWLWTIGLAAKSGAQFRGALPFEDADLHPERYTVYPQFTEEEKSAWKSVSLESALRDQRILKREGIETELV
jgi:predicted secreted protein